MFTFVTGLVMLLVGWFSARQFYADGYECKAKRQERDRRYDVRR